MRKEVNGTQGRGGASELCSGGCAPSRRHSVTEARAVCYSLYNTLIVVVA